MFLGRRLHTRSRFMSKYVGLSSSGRQYGSLYLVYEYRDNISTLLGTRVWTLAARVPPNVSE